MIDISGKSEQSFKAKDSLFFFFIIQTAIKGPRSFQKKKKNETEEQARICVLQRLADSVSGRPCLRNYQMLAYF